MLFVIRLSVVFAATMLVCMAVLVARRWRAERRHVRDAACASDITRAYLRRLGGATDIAPPGPGPVPLDAILRLGQLLRGAERDRLLALAEADGLFDVALSKLHRSRRAGRVDAIRILAQFGSERCVASLQAVMAADPRPELRLEAAGALAQLGRLPSPGDTIAMLGMAKGTPTRLHLAVLRSLASVHVAELGRLLDADFPFALRCMIVDAIGWSGDFSASNLIERAARDDDPELRCAALRAAGQLGRPDVARWILPLLADPSADVRVNAIRACDTLRIGGAVEALEVLRHDQSWWVRSRAEEALATLRPAQSARVAA